MRTFRAPDLSTLLLVVACAPSLGCSVLFGVEEYKSSRCTRPDEGTYRYRESGGGVATLYVTEKSSTGGGGGAGGGTGGAGGNAGGSGGAGGAPLCCTDQPLGPDVVATVTHRSECEWDLSIRRGENQTETVSYRGVENGDTLTELGSVQQSSWDFVGPLTVTTTIDCTIGDTFRPNMRTDDSWTQRCTGVADVEATPLSLNILMEYEGPETLTLASGRQVETHRLRRVTLYNAPLFGVSTATVWFDVSSGLQVKAQRLIALEASLSELRVQFGEASEITLLE
jgi:hypothetical protein